MTDYISRQAALKLIEEDIPITVNPVEVVANILAELEEVPAADVVEVVKCKDCIYRFESSCKWREDETPDPDDYCSIGEKL